MKTLRMLCMVTMYILTAPLLALMTIWVAVYDVVWCIRHKYYDFDFVMSGIDAFVQGVQAGHTINMYWVRHGKKCPVIFDYGIKDES